MAELEAKLRSLGHEPGGVRPVSNRGASDFVTPETSDHTANIYAQPIGEDKDPDPLVSLFSSKLVTSRRGDCLEWWLKY